MITLTQRNQEAHQARLADEKAYEQQVFAAFDVMIATADIPLAAVGVPANGDDELAAAVGAPANGAPTDQPAASGAASSTAADTTTAALQTSLHQATACIQVERAEVARLTAFMRVTPNPPTCPAIDLSLIHI